MIAVVHNGIIENFEAERERLKALGYTFESQTDTEVIAHSVNHEYTQNGGKLFEAVRAATARFHGAYAIAVMAQDKPEEMVVARMGCPLLVALGDQETFIASDVSAVIAFTRRIAYLEDGDIAVLSANGIEKLIDKTGAETQRKVKVSELSLASLELGPYSHFMQKEIHEQPRAIADTAEVFLDGGLRTRKLRRKRTRSVRRHPQHQNPCLRHVLLRRADRQNTGSNPSPKSRPTSKSPANTATAT